MRIRRQEDDGQGLSVYVHIPYCTRKCAYCNFNSIPSDPAPEKRYVECVLKELAAQASGTAARKRDANGADALLETIYIGGGTPSLFSPGAIEKLIHGITRTFPRRPSQGEIAETEITVEANPETLDPEKLTGYLEAGANRLSIGIQSLSDKHLKSIGRGHSAARGIEAFKEARRAGFKNVSIDLIHALPGETLSQALETVRKIINLKPEHVSVYALTPEPGTPLYRDISKGLVKLPLPDEDVQVRMYQRAIETLKKAGYLHYEISNLALPGYQSRHNSGYWIGRDYMGLGAGAHSYSKCPGWGSRRWNEADPERYMERIELAGTAVAGTEELTKDEAATERLFLELRTVDGVDGRAFKKRFGFAPRFALDWARLKDRGLVIAEGDDIRLTPRGITFSNEVF